MRAALLSEAAVGSGHVHGQTVLHPLQERHPAPTLVLKALLPQRLCLQLAAHTDTDPSANNAPHYEDTALLLHVVYNSPAGLLHSGAGVCPVAVETLQATCCRVTESQAAAQLIENVQVSRQAARLQEGGL